MHGVMLFHLSQLLCASMAACHARLFRLLLSMHVLSGVGAASKQEVQFGLDLLRNGPPSAKVCGVCVCV